MSRINKVDLISALTRDNEYQKFFKLRQTTVLEDYLPLDTEWYVVRPNETFEDIAHKEYPELGGTAIWYVLADCNPEIFYPLDLQAGDRIRLPPPWWVEQYLSKRDDWTETWEEIIK